MPATADQRHRHATALRRRILIADALGRTPAATPADTADADVRTDQILAMVRAACLLAGVDYETVAAQASEAFTQPPADGRPWHAASWHEHLIVRALAAVSDAYVHAA